MPRAHHARSFGRGAAHRQAVCALRCLTYAPQDSGKLVHVGAAGLAGSSNSLADYNRAGTPLVEIVTEPDLRSGREAAAYGAEIQRLVRCLRHDTIFRACSARDAGALFGCR